jgi:hypothetical protein
MFAPLKRIQMGLRHARSGFGSKACAKGRSGFCADIFNVTRVCWALRVVQTAQCFGSEGSAAVAQRAF